MSLTVISDKGSPMMVVQKVKRKGDRLEITGQMMGAWPSKMYVTRKEFRNMIPLVFNPDIFVYVLLYPFYSIANLFRPKNIEGS